MSDAGSDIWAQGTSPVLNLPPEVLYLIVDEVIAADLHYLHRKVYGPLGPPPADVEARRRSSTHREMGRILSLVCRHWAVTGRRILNQAADACGDTRPFDFGSMDMRRFARTEPGVLAGYQFRNVTRLELGPWMSDAVGAADSPLREIQGTILTGMPNLTLLSVEISRRAEVDVIAPDRWSFSLPPSLKVLRLKGVYDPLSLALLDRAIKSGVEAVYLCMPPIWGNLEREMCFERITHALSQPENVVKALSIHKRDELDWRIDSGWDVLAQGVQASRQLEKINIEIQASYGESRGTGDEYVIRDELRHSLKLVNPHLKWFWFRWHALKHEWECWCRDHLVATDAAFRTSYNPTPSQQHAASREVYTQFFENPMNDWLENEQGDEAPELRSLRVYISPSHGNTASSRGMLERVRTICRDRDIHLILDEHGRLPEDFDSRPNPAPFM